MGGAAGRPPRAPRIKSGVHGLGAGDELARRFSRLRDHLPACRYTAGSKARQRADLRASAAPGHTIWSASSGGSAPRTLGTVESPCVWLPGRAFRTGGLGDCDQSRSICTRVNAGPQPWRPTKPQCSAFKCPGDHQRELLSPELAAVRPVPLCHDNVGTCTAQRVCPSHRILEEELLLRAAHEVTRGSELGITAGGL